MLVKLKPQSQPNPFDVPEGNFAAELINVGPYEQETKDGITDLIRFVFRVQLPGKDNQTGLAGKNIDPESAKLQRFLTRWLGKEFISSSGDTLDPETLVGKKAEVKIRHISNAGYSRPYCDVEGAYPLGTLNLTQSFKEEAQDI